MMAQKKKEASRVLKGDGEFEGLGSGSNLQRGRKHRGNYPLNPVEFAQLFHRRR
jgi:hypothetical protein